MEKITHHLSDEVLMAYATGSLNEAFSLLVAAHVSMCDTCRAQLETYDTLGGALLSSSDTSAADMGEDSLEATLALISNGPAPVAPSRRVRGGALPGPVQDYVGGDLESVKWRSAGMGVKQAILPTGTDATARLLFIPAGTAVPDHGHRGTEMTLVLQGAFSDEDEWFGPGDVEIADEDLHHTPIADVSQDCICLAVTDAPLKFSGWLPRLAQPFLRI